MTSERKSPLEEDPGTIWKGRSVPKESFLKGKAGLDLHVREGIPLSMGRPVFLVNRRPWAWPRGVGATACAKWSCWSLGTPPRCDKTAETPTGRAGKDVDGRDRDTGPREARLIGGENDVRSAPS